MIAVLRRINAALEWLAPMTFASAACLRGGRACIWHPQKKRKIRAAQNAGHIDLRLLKGIDRQANTLLDNTRRFARGLPANNALLWGARGTGKRSLVKAVHAGVDKEQPGALALIEIRRDDISTLPQLLAILRHVDQRCLLFCDDLSFNEHDPSYRSLKTVLEGGIEGQPENVVFYATSNRRHLMPREMIQEGRSTIVNPAEAVEEQVSLSDRFGLWLGFHAGDQATSLEIVEGYASYYRLDLPLNQLRSEALAWSMVRDQDALPGSSSRILLADSANGWSNPPPVDVDS